MLTSKEKLISDLIDDENGNKYEIFTESFTSIEIWIEKLDILKNQGIKTVNIHRKLFNVEIEYKID